ncbi:MAG: methyltransferase [Desulfobaccales bacterium]
MTHKQAIQRNFARRGASYDSHAKIQQWMAAELLEGCREAVVRARAILEVGCGTGHLTELLRQANSEAALVALDLEVSLLQRARARLGRDAGVHFVAADGEAFTGGTYDLILSNSVFQWFVRPEETLGHYYRMLRPGGMLAFAIMGPATFRELAASFQEAAVTIPMAEFPEVVAGSFCEEKTWRQFLTKAGFRKPVLQREVRTETHPTVRHFLHDLQATGATNPSPRPLSPRLFRLMAAIYHQAYGLNGSIPVTYEVIWAFAKKREFFST